jgi:dolichyl-phosphate beta-glucosyltransferase
MEEKELSIIIPAYGKGKLIINTIKSLLEHFPQAEIIIINDGSKDDTKKIKDIFGAKIIYLENEINYGKGYSLRKGFNKAEGKYLIFTDADLPFSAEYINKTFEKLKEGKSIVIGHRKQFYNDRFYKKFLRPFLYLVLKILFGFNYHDTQCGLKGFIKEQGKRIFSLSVTNGFVIDIEILYLAKKLSYPVEEVEVKQEIFSDSSTFNFSSMLQMLFDLFIIKFRRYEIS